MVKTEVSLETSDLKVGCLHAQQILASHRKNAVIGQNLAF